MALTLNIDWSLLFITSLVIYGVNYATYYELLNKSGTHIDGYIPSNKRALWFLRYYCEKLIGEFWTQPLFSCPLCMSSVWGGTFFFLFSPHITILNLCVHVVALCGLNNLLKNFSQ